MGWTGIWNLPNDSETIHKFKHKIQKQIAFCPSNKTTVLYFGTATCFTHFQPSLVHGYSTAK